jgi:4'-phosphopantetheinyl transferase
MILVHRIDLRLEAEEEVLSRDETARARRYSVQHARRNFVTCRVALRQLLGTHLNVAPTELKFVHDEYGRPSVKGVSFNVSHSGSIGLIAIADGERRLGVDIEQMRAIPDLEALASSCLHPAEVAAVGDRGDAFFRCWTKKEAVVKALGRGLSYPFTTFVVDVDGDAPARIAGVKELTVAGLAVADGYAAALAADADLEYAYAGPAAGSATHAQPLAWCEGKPRERPDWSHRYRT